MLGNRNAHKRARARIAAGSRRPPVLLTASPDLDPIELVVAKVDHARRRIDARSDPALLAAAGPALAAVTSADARAFPSHRLPSSPDSGQPG